MLLLKAMLRQHLQSHLLGQLSEDLGIHPGRHGRGNSARLATKDGREGALSVERTLFRVLR